MARGPHGRGHYGDHAAERQGATTFASRARCRRTAATVRLPETCGRAGQSISLSMALREASAESGELFGLLGSDNAGQGLLAGGYRWPRSSRAPVSSLSKPAVLADSRSTILRGI